MKKTIYEATKKLVLEYYNDRGETDSARLESLIGDMEAGAHPDDKTTYQKAKRAVQNGFFACYFADVANDLAAIYGDEYDDSRYTTKSGDWRIRNGKNHAWETYKAHLALAIEKMIREGQR